MDEDWFSSCLSDLHLPGSPWYEVYDLLSDTLAYRIKLEGLTYDQLSHVSKFVGMDFMKKYQLLDLFNSDNLSAVKSSRLATDAKVEEFLKELTMKSAISCGCSLPVDSSTDKSFKKMLELAENFFQSKINELQSSNNSTEQKCDALGQILLKIIKANPSSMGHILDKLWGQPLPHCFRHYLYRVLLLKQTKKSLAMSVLTVSDAESNITKLRSKFASGVKDGMQELKLKKPSNTSLTKLISSSVKTFFESSSALSEQAKDAALQKQCCRVLNILYTRRRHFEYVYSFWLLPLLETFSKYEYMEKDFEIAMWLDVLIDHCVFPVSVVNQIAFASWQNALKHSNKLHVFQVKSLNSVFQSLDIATDEKTVKDILKNSTQTDINTQPITSLHVILLIRQWLLHLFVGNFDLTCSLFFWDQLFLNNWSQDCFVRVCLVTICALADDISKCESKVALLNIFNKSTSYIRLIDICQHWKKYDELFGG